MSDKNNYSIEPIQRLPDNKKNTKWAEKNVDYAESIALYAQTSGIRETLSNRILHLNLYNGILDESDMKGIINPANINASYLPNNITHYPKINPKISLLLGEELTRKREYRVVVCNPDAISEKETQINSMFFQKIAEKITSQNYNPQQLQKEISQLNDYATYSIQDFREIMGNQALQYLFKTQELKIKFNKGYKDVLINNEEIYSTDIVAGNPVLEKENPLDIFLLGGGDSPYVEDYDRIIKFGYYSFGWVIDNYYDYLTPEEIKELETDVKNFTSKSIVNPDNYNDSVPIFATWDEAGNSQLSLVSSQTANRVFGGAYDMYGNVKIVHTRWSSLRKILKLKFFDELNQQQEKIVHEDYKPNKAIGETVEELWIREWWEGTKIANKYYVKCKPRDVQFRDLTNLSKCKSGFVGTIYNTNSSRGDSLVARLKSYSYLYDIFMYRLNETFAKNPGVLGVLDVSRKPDFLNFEQWLYYAYKIGFVFEDSFREGNKGRATGKLAGETSSRSNIINMDIANQINTNIMMLERISAEMDEISGVSRQRLGAVENRETVGGIERAVKQSSMITEETAALHDNTKTRAITTLLETAQIAWRDNPQKIPFIFDQMTSQLFEFGGLEFANANFGLFASDSSEDTELFNSLKRLMEIGLQNQKITFSEIINMHKTNSISSLSKQLEKSERETMVREQQKFESQIEMQQQQLAFEKENKQKEMLLKQYENDSTNDTKIRVAQITANKGLDNEPSVNEIANLTLKERQHLSNEMEKNLKYDIEDKKIREKARMDAEKLSTQKEMTIIKADATKYSVDKQLEIAKENKNKSELGGKTKKAKE